MKKFKVFWNFEREEAWLSDMARQGHILKKYSVFGRYHFAEGEPQDLAYRVDYRVFNARSDFEDYVALCGDAGWQLVYGSPWGGSQYFLPKEGADRQFFSDRASAAARYKVQYTLCLTNALAALAIVGAEIVLFKQGFLPLGFLTPGLWQKAGPEFWRAFLLELPFAVLRVGIPLFMAAASVLYGYWAARAKKAYDQGAAGGENEL